MKTTILATLLLASLSGTAARADVQPIEGSITYNGKTVHLEKAPVGSTFFHTFIGPNGRYVREVYKVNADRSATLVSRATSGSH
ncbi:hypothetical protein [Rhizobium sp. CECT 9324]|jgi:hypothetical protein|uniref:hypothetical protein n=1 Tax=Rhizobium sp. CECT 9324 TaxID=2845820 RepID=UPI001E327D9E|nr:hypothetical protein [Rhizobium sp. CECT 9324]CAH0341219.1 hypothetical protein RHI9324_02907 [Rhizobium sp. CECT 9324]